MENTVGSDHPSWSSPTGFDLDQPPGRGVSSAIGCQYCAACYPLTASASDGVHCGRYRGALTLRDDDERAAFDERLQRHRVNTANVLALARDLQATVVTLARCTQFAGRIGIAGAGRGRRAADPLAA
jgi:hypothetical protein